MSVEPRSAPQDVAFGWRILDVLIAAKRRTGTAGARLGSFLMVLPAVALVSLLTAGLVLLAWRSFHSFDPFLFRQGPLSLANYREVVDDDLIRTVFVRTVLMTLLTTTVAILIALPLAYVMTRTTSRLVRLLLLITIFLPILTGDIARAYGWLVLLGREGLLSWVVGGDPGLLGTLWAVGIGSVQILIPLSVVILLPSFQRVDTELEQAAATMGAGPVRVWIRVILPLVRPGITGAAAVCITICMTEFANPGLLGNGVRDYVANLVQSVVLGRDNLYLGSAIGLTLLVVVMVCVTVLLLIGHRRGGDPLEDISPKGAP